MSGSLELLALMSPKTSGFSGVVGRGFGGVSAQDVAGALAGLDPLSDAWVEWQLDASRYDRFAWIFLWSVIGRNVDLCEFRLTTLQKVLAVVADEDLNHACEHCQGTGYVYKPSIGKCPVCDGSGRAGRASAKSVERDYGISARRWKQLSWVYTLFTHEFNKHRAIVCDKLSGALRSG